MGKVLFCKLNKIFSNLIYVFVIVLAIETLENQMHICVKIFKLVT